MSDKLKNKIDELLDKAKKEPIVIKINDKKYRILQQEEYLDLLDKVDSLHSSLISELNNEKTYNTKDLLKNRTEKK
tara:strand:+ start:281 stop:508 length:228 start_codon:yes stop_codon:yes gene_type:complete